MQLHIFIIKSSVQIMMQSQDRRQRRLFQLTPHASLLRLDRRENNSLSTSRGKKYFKISDRHHHNRNQIMNSFAKKYNKQKIANLNDYGLDNNVKERTVESVKKNQLRSNKALMKNDQPHLGSKNKLLKNSRSKKHRKYSEQTNSLDSIIKFNDYVTPKKKPNRRNYDKKYQFPSPQATLTINDKDYKKKIEFLQKQNEYYTDLYLNSQQRIDFLKKQTQDQKQKYQRIRRMYQEKIIQMTNNKELCQKNLGHIFSYDPLPADIIPSQVIVQNSIECSIDDLRQSSLRKVSDFGSSKMSTLSINSNS